MGEYQHNNPWAEKLLQVSLPDSGEAWQAMERRLDEQLPRRWTRDSRRWVLLILLLLLLIGVCNCPGSRRLFHGSATVGREAAAPSLNQLPANQPPPRRVPPRPPPPALPRPRRLPTGSFRVRLPPHHALCRPIEPGSSSRLQRQLGDQPPPRPNSQYRHPGDQQNPDPRPKTQAWSRV